MKNAVILATGILLSFTSASQAQNIGGWNTQVFISGAAGISTGGTSDYDGRFDTLIDPDTNSPITFNADRDVSTGFNAEVSAGVQLGQFRVGLDYHYIKSDAESGVLNTSIGLTDRTDGTSGSIHAYMVSGEYEFHTGSGFNPYIGLGIGVADVDGLYDEVNADDPGAYKLTGGVSYIMNSNLSIFGEYNYFSTFEYDVVGTENGERVLSGDSQFSSHLFNVGVRYGF